MAKLPASRTKDEEPHESVTLQLWKLLRMGDPQHILSEVLDEIETSPFSSAGAEQTRSLASRVLKYHPDIGGSYLASRAFHDQMRALVTPHEHEANMSRLLGRIARLSRTKQRAIRGREMYLRRWFEVARGLRNSRP